MLDFVAKLAIVLLVIKILWSWVSLLLSIRYLLGCDSDAVSGRTLPCRIFILIPLLREQERLRELVTQFGELLKRNPSLHLAFVTTVRENIEHGHREIPEQSTYELLSCSSAFLSIPEERRHHFHLGKVNRTLAEQLNYGIKELDSLQIANSTDYILIYNADSAVGDSTIAAFASSIDQGFKVTQQSSLFLKNFNRIAKSRAFLAAADAIYQSRWTLEREIPRYLISTGSVRFVPNAIAESWVAHCVGHGLLINFGILRALNGFPVTKWGLEDSALGFMLRSRGFPIAPLPILENAEAAESLQSLIRQKSTWLRGPLGSLDYFLREYRGRRADRKTFWLACQGLYSGIKWSIGVLVLAAGAIACIYSGEIVAFSLLYAAYCWIPFAALVHLWRQQPVSLFPRPNSFSLAVVFVVYPLAPFVHGIAGLCGTIRTIRQYCLGEDFWQTKTE